MRQSCISNSSDGSFGPAPPSMVPTLKFGKTTADRGGRCMLPDGLRATGTQLLLVPVTTASTDSNPGAHES